MIKQVIHLQNILFAIPQYCPVLYKHNRIIGFEKYTIPSSIQIEIDLICSIIAFQRFTPTTGLESSDIQGSWKIVRGEYRVE